MENEIGLQKFANPAGIEVRSMLQVHELNGRDEDWTGVTSTTMRRKLQNRLNQRAKRRRAQSVRETIISATNGEEFQTLALDLFAQRPTPGTGICIEPVKRRLILGASNFSSFLDAKTPLSADHKLLTLLHFNLIRALSRITLLLGVDPDNMYMDIQSPFHSAASNLSLSDLPPTLQPTDMQLSVPHHPEVDIFPFPRFRDNMIRASNMVDDVEFCQDLVYGIDDGTGAKREVDVRNCAKMTPGGRTGLIVWSDPWLQESWEIEPDFARKYGMLFEGCQELVDSTNKWRASRGEEPLDLEI